MQFLIRTQLTEIPVEAEAVGMLAVHRFPNDPGWNVSHIPTTMRIVGGLRKSTAMRIARELNECGADWKFNTKDAPQKLWSRETLIMVRKIAGKDKEQ